MNTEIAKTPKKSFKVQMLAAREAAIIQSVNRLLAEKGFDAMTVDEVAAEVGIAKASLYKHFTSKEELACAAMVTAMRKAQEFIQEVSAELPPMDKLKAVTRWTMTLKLQGQMPSLPSQNSSLRATLMASKVARRLEFWLGKEGIRPCSLRVIVQRVTALSLSMAACSAGKVEMNSCALRMAVTMAAQASSSLLVKCLYKLALAMPTSAATSSTVIASKPFSASNRLTDWMMAVSRAASIWTLKDFLGGVRASVFIGGF